ncbi:large conductance mechanosensitive channel protein MscL [Pedobacter cryophilus]|uniref:Large-conductance mechanosensitive channel n=1 Tax=Pedobacter cryophilus TaxID=2571271 RepID=A0A4U1C0H7_9SPHI|nr:large conductance mechanosensitive channel protein MscL [Pedobacter cryophilus]TKB99012.1 large conductance mechanosensitive channel protein MscL [Pedobacter cryophilus]
MGFVKEFKEFALKGNVMDLAIAVIIGAAFGKIINSFIEDIITPLLLKPALDAANLTDIGQLTFLETVKYGNFLSAVISFLIVALVLFIIIKAINATKKKKEEPIIAPVGPSKEEVLLAEIRDILKAK